MRKFYTICYLESENNKTICVHNSYFNNYNSALNCYIELYNTAYDITQNNIHSYINEKTKYHVAQFLNTNSNNLITIKLI